VPPAVRGMRSPLGGRRIPTLSVALQSDNGAQSFECAEFPYGPSPVAVAAIVEGIRRPADDVLEGPRHHDRVDAEDFRQVRDAVRQLVRESVLPREEEIEDADRIPDDLRARAADMGLFGYALPEEYGGLGVTMSEDVQLAVEFGYTTPAFRSLFGTNNGIAGQVIAKFGSDEQKQRYLPRLAAGEMVGSFALTEAEAGSDPAGLRTSARRDGDGWVINGSKRYITNAPIADLFVVFARTDPEQRGGRGISSFVVEASTPGVTVGPHDKKMGQSGAWTAEVFLDDVRVPGDALIGEEGRGYAKALTVLSRGRLHIAALCVGMAERVLDESVAYAATAKQGGAPIGRFQLVQAMLADSHAELLAARSMVRDVAARYDSGEDTSVGPSSAKLFCTEMVGRAVDRAVQVPGGMGYLRTTPVERFYRDARLFRLYEGTSEVQRVIVGGALLREAGMPRA
jgi:acyl-CoA dehydrogenase